MGDFAYTNRQPCAFCRPSVSMAPVQEVYHNNTERYGSVANVMGADTPAGNAWMDKVKSGRKSVNIEDRRSEGKADREDRLGYDPSPWGN